MYCVYIGYYKTEKEAKKDRNKIKGTPYLFHIDNHYCYKVFSGNNKELVSLVAKKYQDTGFLVRIKEQ